MTENDREKEQAPANFEGEQFDAASKSLTDALRLSFAILKVIMVILIVLFLTSGFFQVEPGEEAIVLRLGKIRELTKPGMDTPQKVLLEGFWWTWPAPISEVVKIPSNKKQTMPQI